MMLSAPAADNEMYSLLLLRLVSDPDGAKKRLDELSAAATANAEAYRQQLQGIEDAKAAAHDTIAKAAADEAQATENLAQANALLAANNARSIELTARFAELTDAADSLTNREAALKATAAAQDAAFAERERVVAGLEAAAHASLAALGDERAAVNALKSDLEDRTAKLKALLA